jgi:hypothetical protein
MELHELRVLQRDSSTQSHSGTVSSAGMGRGGREVATTVSSSGDDGLLAVETMNGSILKAQSHHTHTLVSVHDQIQGVVLNEVGGVVGKGATVQGVKHGVTSTIGSSSSTISLTTLTIVLGLSTKGTLINLSVLTTREGKTIGFQLTYSTRSFTTHVVNSILVTKPIGTLHSIIEMPTPIILMLDIIKRKKQSYHVTKSSIDTTLSSNSMRTRREQLGNDSSLESLNNKKNRNNKSTCSERPIAARRPAPPAPTTTQSYS